MCRLWSIFSLFTLFSYTIALSAVGAELRVIPSSTEIALDENLSLDFQVSVKGTNSRIGSPEFDAPDFEEVNIYSRSTSIESSLINGQLTVVQTQSMIVVLHPKKEGKSTIKNLQVKVGNDVIKAPNIEIEVHPIGTLKKRGRWQPNQKSALPPSGLGSSQQRGSEFFIKTEPNKLKAYKGEQIVLTYALYTRSQVMGIQVERYPTVPGFLKEDLDIPVLGGRLTYQPSVVGGKEYNRAVLAQYAIFPVKEGTLRIDPFTAKFTVRRLRPSLSNDDDDPFGLNRFFQAVRPYTAVKSSDRVSIEVLPLPAAGQPANFSGLVGDFSITAVVDKYTVKAGEPINLKVKIEGMGHAGSLERLNIAWPQDFELYEDKSSSSFQKTGFSERIFDYMVIPRVKGNYQIPEIELTMFNPETKAYQIRKTPPIQIEVLEGNPGDIYIPKKSDPKKEQPTANKDIRYWNDDIPTPTKWLSFFTNLAVAISVSIFLLGLTVAWQRKTGSFSKLMRDRQKMLIPQTLLAEAKNLGSLRFDSVEPNEVLNRSESILGRILDHLFKIQIGSMTRAEIKARLLEHRVEENLANQVERFLEKCENARYMPEATEQKNKIAHQAKSELVQIVEEFFK